MFENFLKDEFGLSTGFLKSAMQGDEDQFVESGPLRVRIIFEAEEEMLIWFDFTLSFLAIVVVLIAGLLLYSE